VSSFTVKRGKRYRATITLDFLEQLAGNDTIAAKLQAAGFEQVHVSGSGATRHAEAVWPNADTTAPLPPQVIAVSEIEAA